MFADNQAPKYKKMNFGPALFWTLEVESGKADAILGNKLGYHKANFLLLFCEFHDRCGST